jgi:hypothetical protein
VSGQSSARIAGALMALTLVAALLEGLPGRTVIIVVGLLVAPGLAIASLASVEDRIAQLLLTVPVSIVVVGLVSTGAIYLGQWNTLPIIAIVATITFLAAALGTRERAARLVFVVLTMLPGIVVLSAAVSIVEI